MKTDRYTKIVLTVIALCMVVNVLDKINIIPNAYAKGTNETAVKKPEHVMVPLNADGSINVKVTAPTDVNIVGIRTYDDLDVNVNLSKIGGYSTYGEIPVKVKQ